MTDCREKIKNSYLNDSLETFSAKLIEENISYKHYVMTTLHDLFLSKVGYDIEKIKVALEQFSHPSYFKTLFYFLDDYKIICDILERKFGKENIPEIFHNRFDEYSPNVVWILYSMIMDRNPKLDYLTKKYDFVINFSHISMIDLGIDVNGHDFLLSIIDKYRTKGLCFRKELHPKFSYKLFFKQMKRKRCKKLIEIWFSPNSIGGIKCKKELENIFM